MPAAQQVCTAHRCTAVHTLAWPPWVEREPPPGWNPGMPGGATGSQRAPGGRLPCPGGPPTPPPMRPGPKMGSPGPTCMPPPRCGPAPRYPAHKARSEGGSHQSASIAGAAGKAPPLPPLATCMPACISACPPAPTWQHGPPTIAGRPHPRRHHILCPNAHWHPRRPVADATHPCSRWRQQACSTAQQLGTEADARDGRLDPTLHPAKQGKRGTAALQHPARTRRRQLPQRLAPLLLPPAAAAGFAATLASQAPCYSGCLGSTAG